MRKEFGYENWDSHRDMILRSYVLDDNMLTWNQMGVFGKTSLGNESVYNSGFALTSYIAQQYGEAKLRLITQKLGNTFNFTIDAAFEDVLEKDGNEIYDEWKAYLTKCYNERTKDVKSNLKDIVDCLLLVGSVVTKVHIAGESDCDFLMILKEKASGENLEKSMQKISEVVITYLEDPLYS